MAFYSSNMAIDMGTVNTLVYIKGKGVVLNEPTVVVIRNDKKEIVAIGEEARRMIGKTPGNAVAVRPLRDGVISDYEMTEIMLKYFIKKTSSNLFPFNFRAKLIICVPCGITEVERKAVEGAARTAGARDVVLMEEPVAAALGAGLNISDAKGNMIIVAGGGTTDIAVISLNGIVVSKSLRLGGNRMDEAVVNYIRKQYNVIIGEMTAERVKMMLGSVYEPDKEEKMLIRGRNIKSGMPAELTINSVEIKKALEEPIRKIIDAVKAVMELTPPELSADIIREGITISGGTALLKGINRLISKETGISVKIAPDPLKSVISGAGSALDGVLEYAGIINVSFKESM